MGVKACGHYVMVVGLASDYFLAKMHDSVEPVKTNNMNEMM